MSDDLNTEVVSDDDFSFEEDERIAVQRAAGAGKVARLHYLQGDDTLRNLKVGGSLNITAHLIEYAPECEKIINRMFAEQGSVPSKDRAKVQQALTAFRKEFVKLHGEKSDFMGGYFPPKKNVTTDDEGVEHVEYIGDARYGIKRTK